MKNKHFENLSVDKKARFVELSLDYMEIRSKLWNEYPERMKEMAIKSAQIMLRHGLINCQHESGTKLQEKIESGAVQEVRTKLDEFEKRIARLESPNQAA